MNTPITDNLLRERGFHKVPAGDFTKHPEHRDYWLLLKEYEQDERHLLGIKIRPTNGSDIRYWWLSFFRNDSGGGREVSLKAIQHMEQIEAFIAWFAEDNS